MGIVVYTFNPNTWKQADLCAFKDSLIDRLSSRTARVRPYLEKER